jgi:hypothetical protein
MMPLIGVRAQEVSANVCSCKFHEKTEELAEKLM